MRSLNDRRPHARRYPVSIPLTSLGLRQCRQHTRRRLRACPTIYFDKRWETAYRHRQSPISARRLEKNSTDIVWFIGAIERMKGSTHFRHRYSRLPVVNVILRESQATVATAQALGEPACGNDDGPAFRRWRLRRHLTAVSRAMLASGATTSMNSRSRRRVVVNFEFRRTFDNSVCDFVRTRREHPRHYRLTSTLSDDYTRGDVWFGLWIHSPRTTASLDARDTEH